MMGSAVGGGCYLSSGGKIEAFTYFGFNSCILLRLLRPLVQCILRVPIFKSVYKAVIIPVLF